MKRLGLLLIFGLLLKAGAAGAEPLVVHEWGTFTSLQDEEGKSIGGINTDDEPVPPFVHNIASRLLIPPTEAPPTFFQGAPACHPDVTLRLETPVLYVHAPESFHGALGVKVAFHGGWLTQFYPAADAIAPGVTESGFGRLKSNTVGTLDWRSLTVNPPDATLQGPETKDRVWLAPRNVEANLLTGKKGESERFLFYRGVGAIDAPLRVVQEGATLRILPNGSTGQIGRLWLADIRPDGTGAYRTLSPASPEKKPLATTPATFGEADYSATAIATLRLEMKAVLVKGRGLFADEAEALLNTWELSYFRSPGLRLFFMVPAEWTDSILPLTLSGPAEMPKPSVTRVMVGRIEIVSPHQRTLLARIAAGPVPDPWKDIRQKADALTLQAGKRDLWNDLVFGKRSFREIGVEVPPVFQAYLDLGRFRNALILDEQKRRPTPVLDEFIRVFGLGAFKGFWGF